MVSISGMTVSLKTDLWFPITGQQGHESRNIQLYIADISRILYNQVYKSGFSRGVYSENFDIKWLSKKKW